MEAVVLFVSPLDAPLKRTVWHADEKEVKLICQAADVSSCATKEGGPFTRSLEIAMPVDCFALVALLVNEYQLVVGRCVTKILDRHHDQRRSPQAHP